MIYVELLEYPTKPVRLSLSCYLFNFISRSE